MCLRGGRGVGEGGEDVAQLAECWTGTQLTQVRFPGVAKGFSPRINFQRRLSYVSVHLHVQSHALISVGTSKIL